MAQMTGTEMLAYARLLAQEGDTPPTEDADALLLLNDVLLKWQRDIEVRVTNLSAATTGCTIAAGTASKVLTDSTIEDIQSFHPSASSALSYPLSQPLGPSPVANEQIWAAYNRTPANQTIQTGSEWEAWSYERSTEDGDFFNILVFPALKVDGYATLKVTKRVAISALTDTPQVSYNGGRLCSRFLAYELARLQKQNDPAWLEGIFRPVPRDVMQKWFGEARFQAAVPSGVRDTGMMAG